MRSVTRIFTTFSSVCWSLYSVYSLSIQMCYCNLTSHCFGVASRNIINYSARRTKVKFVAMSTLCDAVSYWQRLIHAHIHSILLALFPSVGRGTQSNRLYWCRQEEWRERTDRDDRPCSKCLCHAWLPARCMVVVTTQDSSYVMTMMNRI